MSILNAIKEAEMQAELMRSEAHKKVSQAIEEARLTAAAEVKKLEDDFLAEKVAKEKEVLAQIDHDEAALIKKTTEDNEKLLHKAKKSFPQAINIILNKVSKQ